MMFASVSSFVGDMCRVSLATQTKRKTPQRTEQRASHERRVTCHDVMRRLCRKKKSSFPCFVVKEEDDSLRLSSFDARDTTRYIYIYACAIQIHTINVMRCLGRSVVFARDASQPCSTKKKRRQRRD